MIPKTIHYCWFGGNPLPKEIKKYIESWKKYCPDYEIKEWNENNFDVNSNTYVKEAYKSKKWAFVTDYVRLYALYHEGGIYMDTDVELLKNIDEYLIHTAFSGFEDDTHIPTAIMGSEKYGKWVEYLLSYYKDKHFIMPNGDLDITTNVTTITNMTEMRYHIRLDNTYQELDEVVLYPKDYFCPKSYETNEINLTSNTVCIHHFNASWHSKYECLCHKKKNIYIKKYGQEKGIEKYKHWEKINFFRTSVMRFGIVKCIKKALQKIIIYIFRKIGYILYGKNIILMESINGFDGNTGALYNYLCSNEQYNNYKFVWFLRENIKTQKVNDRTWKTSFQNKSLKIRILSIAAKYIIFDNVPIYKNNKYQTSVYLTHGCPPLKNVRGLINVPHEVDHILCPSENLIDLITYQFSANKENIFICGLPRNDALFKVNVQAENIMNIKKYKKTILWLPTFRKSAYEDRNDSGKIMALGIPLIENEKELDELNEYLYSQNVQIIIKMHPGQDMSIVKVKSYSNIILMSDSELKERKIDLYSLMPLAHALLTDYSSAAFDYMLLDRPIGYVIDDIKEYHLGFAFENPENMMPGNKIKSIDELYSFIEEIVANKDMYREERKKVLEYINKYPDANNCKRIAEYLSF